MNITAIDAPVLSGVSDLFYMFFGCSSLNPTGAAAIALNTWNTATINTMDGMFYNATTFNQDIGYWNTAAVTDMASMFDGARAFNQDISNWNTSAVTTMAFMFADARVFNQEIGKWNTGSVTTMYSMFSHAISFNGNIGNWNTAAVINMGVMFSAAVNFNQNLNNWNTAAVTSMFEMFEGDEVFNGDVSSWNTASVKNMFFMFYGNREFNQNITGWNTAQVTDMGGMFGEADSFNQDISNWITGNVTNMVGMFNLATAFNQNLGRWNISQVKDMQLMLDNCGLSKSNYDSTLIGWARQTVKQVVKLGAMNLKYCEGANARTTLTTIDNWLITGDALQCAVPIQLISFTVQKSGTNVVQINWASGVENNIAFISVEHSSAVANWQSIYSCAPKGSDSKYKTLDINPVAGTNYYRLLTTDLDGSQRYSDIKSVNFSSSLLPNVFPNPASGFITIRNIKTGDVIILTDITGRQMLKKQASAERQIMDIQSFSKGMYFISVVRDGKIVFNDKITKL
ncbi:MAG: BspA family leucine-rich repeat surface protein [Ginsengibacter sp.]